MLMAHQAKKIVMIVILLLVIMHSCPLISFLWFLGLEGSVLVILLVHIGCSNISSLLFSSWSFLLLGVCIQFSTVLS